MSQIYNLKGPQPARRTGLTRADWAGRPPLHPAIRVPQKTLQSMPPKKAKPVVGKIKQEVPVKEEPEEDIYAAPKDSDDSDSEDLPSADIARSSFGRASEEPKPQTTGTRSRPSRTVNRRDNALKGKDTNSSLKKGSKPSGLKSSPNSSQGSNSPKRKSQEENVAYGQGMTDAFGRVAVTTKRRKYGSSQPKYGSSQPTSSLTSNKSKVSEDSPKKSFIKPDRIPESDDDDLPKKSGFKKPSPMLYSDDDGPPKKSGFKKYSPMPDSDDDDLPQNSRFIRHDPIPGSDDDDPPPARSGFKKYDLGESPIKSSPVKPGKFRRVSIPDSPVQRETEQLPSFNKPFAADDDLISISPIRDRFQKAGPPAAQFEAFRKIGLLEGLDDTMVDTARNIISTAGHSRRVESTFEDDFPSMTQLARCPMCNQPVDHDDLRALKGMNTRRQEKFCQSHQKKTAMEEWELKDYPEIEWENLDSRIAKHHAFIRELVNGKECYYRLKLEEVVRTGKDRNLLKTESLLTPGYYGSRGLQVISDSIMKEFTPLLKKQAVNDRIMSARGVTGFVQLVLVPEVTVLLIKEDMKVDVEQAREIMVESIRIGELVHEEIKDVVVHRVEDSEDDDDIEFDD